MTADFFGLFSLVAVFATQSCLHLQEGLPSASHGRSFYGRASHFCTVMKTELSVDWARMDKAMEEFGDYFYERRTKVVVGEEAGPLDGLNGEGF